MGYTYKLSDKSIAAMKVALAGCPASCKSSDIHRDVEDYIFVKEETDEEYIGSFVEGFGFINVHFSKNQVRELTEDERNKWRNAIMGMNM